METNDLVRGLSSISTDAATAVLSALFSRLPLGIALIDPDLTILAANDAFAKQTGLPLDQTIGRSALETIPDLVEELGRRLREVRETEEPGITEHFPFEFRSDAERSISYRDSSIFPILDQTGKFIGHLMVWQGSAEPHDREQESTATDECERANEERARMIEQLTQAHREAQIDRARWQAVLESMPEMVTMCDSEGRVTYVNAAQARLFGFRADPKLAVEQHPAHFGIYRSDGALFLAEELPLQRAALHGEEAREVEVILRTTEGEERTTVWDASPLRDPEGNIIGAVAVGKDVTERKRAEAERERLLADLEEANRRTRFEQARWQAVVENILDPVTVADAQGHATYMNPSYSALVGMTIQEGLSLQEHPTHYRLYHPDGTFFGPEELPLQRAVLRNEVVRNVEIVQVTADGSRRIAIWHAAPLRDEEGRVIGSVAVGRDVTEQRQIEDEREQLLDQLQEANKQLVASSLRNQQLATQAEKQLEQMNALLRSLREGVTVVDQQGHILLRNDAAQEIFGDLDEAVSSIFDSTHAQILGSNGEPLPPELLPISRVLRGEQLVNEEATVVRADGSNRRVVFGSGAVLDEQGQVEMAILVYRDVTELRNLEQSREEFLSMISHDLRAPITVVQGNAQIIQRMTDRPEMVRQSAESIYTAAHRMNRMIQDLVDSARLESGQLHLERMPLEVASFAVELKQRFSLSMDTDRISIEMPESCSTVLADPDRLERILTNLLSNALKYSDGTVEVKVEEGGGEVKVSVIDHGAGIDRDELPHLFERFYRAKSSKRKEGLGLGLYITRMLVEAHGGRIWAESEPERGSTFCFTLPVMG